MPTNRTPLNRPGGLTWAERQALEGFDSALAFYKTEERYRDGWERHRERLLDECRDGWRPQAWWDFESPIPKPPDLNYTTATLWEHELLYPDEVVALERRWREEFDRCNSPDWIGICVGNDPVRHCAIWATDDEGRQATYRHHGIPPAPVKRWSAQRQRTLHALKSEAAE